MEVIGRPARVARLCRGLGALAFAGFMIAAFTPLPNLLGAWLGVRERVMPADAIVVLGAGGVWDDGMPGNPSLRRAVRGILLHRRGLAPLLVFSGSPPEVAARVTLARDLNVPPEQVLADATPRTTREEARQMAALLAPRGVRTILLVSDSQHLVRARGLFERAGFQVFTAAAADAPAAPSGPEGRLALTRVIVSELLARLYYRTAGYL